MAEYVENKEPIVFINNTDSDFNIAAGIVFRKSGLYDVSIDDKTITITKIPSETSTNNSEPKTSREHMNLKCSFCRAHKQGDTLYARTLWSSGIGFDYIEDIKYCPICGRKLFSGEE